MPGQIAQLIVPADGGGNPQFVVPDWPRGRLYFIGQGALRSYSIALETQSPIASSLAYTSTMFCADVDPVSGSLLIQRAPEGGTLPNGDVLYRLDPNTFTVTASFGAFTSFPSWPNSFWASQQVVCVACGTSASGGTTQIGYALFKESEFSGNVGAVRIDTMQQAGFYSPVVSGSTDNRGFMCRGKSGSGGASVFLTWSTTTPTPTIPLYTVTISPGAETYDTTSWPATNPHIHQAVVGNIAAASVDPTWSNLAANSIGYDQTDGNVLMMVNTNDTVTYRNYLIKVNASTAAVMWATPAASGPITEIPGGLQGYNVSTGTVGLIGNSSYGMVASHTGSLASSAIGGLSLSLFGSGSYQWGSLASDTAGLFFVAPGPYNALATNAPTPVAGTPSTFSGFAFIGGLFPATITLTDAELLFSPTAGFVDFTNAANRRLFIASGGTPQWMGTNGAIPFSGVMPAVYLTLPAAGERPEDFAQNAGAGGAFTVTEPITDAVNAPGCTSYYLTEAAGPEANPQWRLSVSDDGGRTWSTLVKPRDIGQLGQYRNRLRWLKMGQARTRMVRLECTDPVRRNIVGIYIDTGQAMG